MKNILNDNSEKYKEELKTERNKDNNATDFAKKLVEKGNVKEAISFLKHERKEERKQEIIKNIFILLSSFVLLFIVYLISK